MLKRFLSVLLAVMMVVSVMAVGVVSSSAVVSDEFTPDSNTFYFDVDGTGWTMGSKDKIAFYFAGGDFDTEENTFKPLAWGAKKLAGTAVAGEDGVFGFNPFSKLDGFSLTPGKQYKLIFARMSGANWAEQSCSLFFTDACLGHVAYSDGTEMENDVDSSKKSKTVYWKGIDPAENGPVLAITSVGNVVGSCVEQGKTKYSLFVEFLSEPKEDFKDQTCYQNAHKYKCEISKDAAGYKSEQQLIDDIGAGLELTKDDIQKALNEDAVKEYFATSGLGCSWSYDASPLPAAHTHTPAAPVQENVIEATCTESGSFDEVVYCSECNEEISRETKTIDPLNHNVQFVEEVPPTATVNGVAAHYECTRCHKCYTDAEGKEEIDPDTLIIKPDKIRGNANANEAFEVSDCTTVQRVLAELLGKDEYDAEAADADLDGIVDILDVTLMQRVLANLTTFEKWDERHKPV